MRSPLGVAQQFIDTDDAVAAVEKYGHGIIHDTYLVKQGSGEKAFILQRINTHVFQDPEAIMHNLRIVCEHMRQRLESSKSKVDVDWQLLQGITARDGRDFVIDENGAFWRALRFIEGAPLEKIARLQDAGEAGRALGIFHRLTSDLNPELLHETLPGFHSIEHYLVQYDAARRNCPKTGEAEIYCQQFIENRMERATVLELGRSRNLLRLRVIHGDPKINNIMVDRVSGRAVSMIDLDTVMGGLVHYDIGDCLRSCCNTITEDAADLSEVKFDLARCQAALTGYIEEAKGFLTDSDFDFFYDCIRLIPFELGLRFYTDFLAGNVYFKISHRDQNRERAMVQFKLVESIEAQEEGIRAIIEGNRLKIRRQAAQ